MVCSGCGQDYEGGGTDGVCPVCRVDGQTLTLWEQSIPPDATAEDSIRSPQKPLPTSGKTVPHRRNLGRESFQTLETEPDFELGEELGAGGMGVVYTANQTVFNRPVAIKMVKPGRADSISAADALMAEAVVTGNLEHPNVVPVYDLGADADDNLFYAMKEVQGFPWSILMAEKTLDENLDILLRVADTISFAHSKGILHRDLKPHNIMLGEFGEIMVMDWGASCALDASGATGAVSSESSCCGTPAYMAPEMARADTNRLGVASDVYLLGAILYQILTGHPPRRERDPVLCLAAAAENHVDPVDEDSELSRIAFKAMATVPADRYEEVPAFQRAIRQCRSHAESIQLLANAKAHLARAKAGLDYDLFNRAVYGFREARELWEENPDAERLRREALREYARCAYEKADFELAQSLLDPAFPGHVDLLASVARAIRDRDAHKKRIRRLLFAARLLAGGLLVLFAVAFFMIRSEQRKTAAQHRRGLVNLVAAQYSEQSYEAMVATFWELHDQYGLDTLDEEMLLNVRVANAMNPYRGSINSGVRDVLKIFPSTEEGYVWVVGREELCKIRLNPAAGYKADTEVAIHDYKFGKYNPPGTVQETVDLPATLASGEAFHESLDGTLWAGAGTRIYKYGRADRQWIPVIDVGAIGHGPLPEKYNIEVEEKQKALEWMNREGRKLPITGLLLTADQSRAAVAQGGGVVCWIDLEESKSIGWFNTGLMDVADPATGRSPLLNISPDERWLIFRDGTGYQSYIFTFDLMDFSRQSYFYAKDYTIRSAVFSHPDRFIALTRDGLVSAPPNNFMKYFGGFLPEPNDSTGRWFMDPWQTRRLPYWDCRLAAFAPNGARCCVLTEDGLLFAGSSLYEGHFDCSRQILKREAVDCRMTDTGYVMLLTKAGRVDLYDMNRYAVADVPLAAKVIDVCTGYDPGNLFALVEHADGTGNVLEIDSIRSDTPVTTLVLTNVTGNMINCDPRGRYLVASADRNKQVFDLETKRPVFDFITDLDSIPLAARFDADGSCLVSGGGWSWDTHIFTVGDWTPVYSNTGGGFNGCLLDRSNGHLHAVIGRGAVATSYRVAAGEDPPLTEEWKIDTAGSALSFIPFTDPATKQRRYWCRSWFDRFRCYTAEDGSPVSEPLKYWFQRRLNYPVYVNGHPLVVFPMQNSQLNIVLKTDLYPIFDNRITGDQISRVALNSDASVLATVSKGKLKLVNLSGTIAAVPLPTNTPTHYVSKSGSETWPYATWESAARNIQTAVDLADDGDAILVDNGTYLLNRAIEVAARENLTIRSKNGLEHCRLKATSHNGVLSFNYCSGLVAVQGFSISGGQNDDGGGGIHAYQCESISIAGCSISNCTSAGNGGGLKVAESLHVDIADCTVADCRSDSEGAGGGVSFYQCGDVTVSNSAMVNCQATRGRGGGLTFFFASNQTSRVTFSDCVISNNVSAKEGGGLKVYIPPSSDGTLLLKQCVLSGNSTGRGGGGASIGMYGDAVDFQMVDCRISGNTATGPGGGINVKVAKNHANIRMSGCLVNGNISRNGSGGGVGIELAPAAQCSVGMTGCSVRRNGSSGAGGGVDLQMKGLAGTVELTGCTISENRSAYRGGGLRYTGFCENVDVSDCIFSGNESGDNGGGLVCEQNTGKISIRKCVVSGNTAAKMGGGISCDPKNKKRLMISDSLIVKNTAMEDGGGVRAGNLVNCTVAGNRAGFGGGTVGAALTNCIVYCNSASNSTDIARCQATYTCSTVFEVLSDGNITNAPGFVDLGGGDYHLLPGSPCIDRGTNAPASKLDLDGNPRHSGGSIDMGCYECQ